MRVKIQTNELSQIITYENVIDCYTENQLYCIIFIEDGKLIKHKYPLQSLFLVVEDVEDSVQEKQHEEHIFTIHRLWIDVLENRDAYGFELIGKVNTKEEADRICSLEYIPKSKYPWPLKYAHEFKGDSVPKFICKEVKDISNLSLEELKSL